MYFHLIDKNNYFFKELFSIDALNRYLIRYEECRTLFGTCRKKKNHCGSSNFPLNVLQRRKKSYDFCHDEKTVNDFIFSVVKRLVVSGNVTLKVSMEPINYQSAKTDRTIELEAKRTWLTDVYTCIFFIRYVQQELKKNYENGNYKRYDWYQLAV